MIEFLLGYAVGEGASSSDTYRTKTVDIQSSPADVYVNVSALHRIKNPLEIKTGCTGWIPFFADRKHRQGTFAEIFDGLDLVRPQDYTVLRITRQISGSSTANFWFEFIENKKLTQEEQ